MHAAVVEAAVVAVATVEDEDGVQWMGWLGVFNGGGSVRRRH
jgi:hypothetical protein